MSAPPPSCLPLSLQVEAERALLRAALRDPANQRFLFLSESCVPLYPAPAVYLQLLAERSSRVWACADASEGDVRRRMDFRWSPAMAATGVERRLWRKSAQWAALQRRHAGEKTGAERSAAGRVW